MALTVVVRSGDLTRPASVTFDAPRIVIGRSKSSEILLPDPSVSHRHASIRQRGTDYVLLDEGSTNGTFVGPVRLSPQAPRMLRSGDLVRVGRIWLEIRIEQQPITRASQQATREIALSLVASALDADASGVCVRRANAPDDPPLLVLEARDRTYVIGRDPGVDLSLDDPDLSRRHLELVRRGGQLSVRDLGSKNRSFLDEAPLEPKRELPWPVGAKLRIGQELLVYDDPVRRALDEIEALPDEPMRDDDSVDPPVGVPASAALPNSAPKPSERRSPTPVERSARRADAANHGVQSARPARTTGVGPWDLLVVLVALLVLGLSLVGIWLLFRA